MILDGREIKKLAWADQLAARRRTFLNGREVHEVWYADTDIGNGIGLVRTLDVLGDGRRYPADRLRETGRWQNDWDVVDGIASKTMTGKVTFQPYMERRR